MAGAAKALSVAVRCRPTLPHDRDKRPCIQVHGSRDIECLDPEHLHAELRNINGRPDYLKENHNRERSYRFDAVFGPSASNQELFERLVMPVVPQVVAGKHATCFAYGQTGSGKTHTMLGRQGETGLVERALVQLLGDAPGEAIVSATFVEVYNERIRDLLRENCPTLDLREDPLRGPCIAGVSEVPTKTAERVMQLVRLGNERRTEERTAANPVSSRSHAVLQLHVEIPLPPQKKGVKRSRFARLSLIDLAGSERAANTGNSGARLREGAMINRSLLALANCITALTRKGAYVNYRDSKLTRLLKDSLSGNCNTVMIAHVSPSISSFEETLNTLKYAHRACEIRGMNGGVRENVCVAAAQYAERLRRTCIDATRGIGRTLAQLALPRPPAAKAAAGLRSEDAVGEGSPSPGQLAAAPAAVSLADKLQRSKREVARGMRERLRLGQTAMELEDQNEANAVELSRLKLCALCGPGEEAQLRPPAVVVADPAAQHAIQDAHEAICADTRRNEQQQRRVAQAVARAEGVAKDKENEQRLVSLLKQTKAVVEGAGEQVGEVSKRMLHAEHANALLELEKVESEQQHVLLEAAVRRHEIALRKQALQLDVQKKALAAAEALLARHGLADEWRSQMGPLAGVMPGQAQQAADPSVDDLLAELNAAPQPVRPRSSALPAALPPLDEGDEEEPQAGEVVAEGLAAVEKGFGEVKELLGRSVRLEGQGRLSKTYASDYEDEGSGAEAGGGSGSGSASESSEGEEEAVGSRASQRRYTKGSEAPSQARSGESCHGSSGGSPQGSARSASKASEYLPHTPGKKPPQRAAWRGAGA